MRRTVWRQKDAIWFFLGIVVAIAVICVLILPGCNSQTEQKDISSDSSSVVLNTVPGSENNGESSPTPESSQGSYDLPLMVNCGMVFRGVVDSVEEFDFKSDALDVYVNDPVKEYLLNVTIKEVYSGTSFKAGETVAIYCADYFWLLQRGTEIVPGKEFVFFSADMNAKMVLSEDTKNEYEEGITLRQYLIQWGGEERIVLLNNADLEGNSLDGIFPYENSLISAPSEWATETKPTKPLSKEAEEELSDWFPGKTMRQRVYYSEEDFIKALNYYKEKYPFGSSYFE